jgi:hypothetical protein
MIGGSIFGAMLLAFLLKQRLFGKIAYSDVFVPMIFLTLAQYETLIGTPNPSYSAFPLLLIMLYGLALLERRYLLKYGMVLVLNFLLIYTGLGLFMGVITIGIFALDCYCCLRKVIALPLAAPLAGLLVAIISLGSFFLGYTFQSAVDCFEFPHHNLAQYPWFVALMFPSFAGIRSPIVLATFLGIVILSFAILVVVSQVRHLIGGEHRFRPIHLTITVMLAYSLLFSLNTSVGRVCLGLPEAAQQSRYTTLLIPAFLAMYFYLLTLDFGPLRHLLIAFLIVLVIPGHLHMSGRAHWFADGKHAWAECYKQTEDIGFCDSSTSFQVYPNPERTRLKQKLDYLKQHRLNLFTVH